MQTVVRITILSLVLLLGACSSIRFDGSQATITVASYRSQPEAPIVAVRLLNEPLPALQQLPPIAPLSVEPPKPVIPDIVENILFESDSSTLSPTAITQLDHFAITVADGDYQILIEGHTDSSHSFEYNHTLSEARATAVKNGLLARGIQSSRLVIEYHGETQAVASNDHSHGKQQNRRVELRPIKPFVGFGLAPVPKSPTVTQNTGLKPFSLQPHIPKQTVSDHETLEQEIIEVQIHLPKTLEKLKTEQKAKVDTETIVVDVDAATDFY
ncbi:OmpA family protein [Candidatus Albibeggiatoa sp. nov. NOAA]|uniref:OmpA family protein n=1 Tax=Candidatus Albibeggiatoa sp. nov. NOAA TaxID=3162724 RepID=UPI0032F246EE|nr:OmpA family protein [Thiotrichaceae bacterium]